MGSSESGGWSMAPGMLRELRLKKAEQALAEGMPELAVVEAEELLDEEADHIEALLIVGDASLELAMPLCAQATYEHVLSLRARHPRALSGLCIARFEQGSLTDCAALAREALAASEAMVEPWYYLGLALERLGQQDEADRALARAAGIAPDLYPLVSPTPDAAWPGVIQRARALLPPQLRDWLAPVPLEHRRFPDMAELPRLDPDASPTVPALFTGEPPPLAEAPPWHLRPRSVLLFRGNLERIAVTERIDLAQMVAESLRLEALDWLGLEVDALALVSP